MTTRAIGKVVRLAIHLLCRLWFAVKHTQESISEASIRLLLLLSFWFVRCLWFWFVRCHFETLFDDDDVLIGMLWIRMYWCYYSTNRRFRQTKGFLFQFGATYLERKVANTDELLYGLAWFVPEESLWSLARKLVYFIRKGLFLLDKGE